MRRFIIALSFAMVALSLCPFPGSIVFAQDSNATLRRVIVEGSQRIEAATVKSYLALKPGELITPAALDKGLKRLFKTGLFVDVTIRQQGNDVIVRTVENPIINLLVFEGNKRIDDEILRDEVQLRPRIVFTRARARLDQKRIIDIYRRSGRFSATVTPKVIQLPQNRVNLIFEINEGELTKIRKITFVGNKEFSDRKLREVVLTKESAWWRFLSSDDSYDRDRLTFDRELLRRHYLANGYADFRVLSGVAELTPDNSAFFITFSIEEGERYKVGKVRIKTALKRIDTEKAKAQLSLKQGDWYNADTVEDVIGRLTKFVEGAGYAFVDIRPKVSRDLNKRKVDLTFSIRELPKVLVELINISGNVRTTDKVIRREVLLVEGDAFNTSKLRRSRSRIRNLGFFERVKVEKRAGSNPEKMVVNIAVSEKSTGEISFGAGYSSTNGVMGDISVKERNFLGRGQVLKVGLQLGEDQQQVDLSFTEPYFLDRKLRAGFDVFSTKTDLSDSRSYTKESLGFALRAGYKLGEKLTESWMYTLRDDEVTDVASNASRAIKEQEGTFLTSSVGHYIRYDTRDNLMSPRSGYYVYFGNVLAGLGGDSQYLKNELRSEKYFPVRKEMVFKIGASTGYVAGINKDVRINDRFFLGGEELRGFKVGGVGPRDLATKDSLGGNWYYRGTMGFQFPLGLPNEFGVRGIVYSDAGGVGDIDTNLSGITDNGSIRASVGVGILWNSPFGPMKLNFAQPLIKESFDETQLFTFGFGAKL